LPLESFLSGPVLQDLRREYGKKAAEKATLEDCIFYWWRYRSKYPRPLIDRELLANYEKKKKEEEMERQRLREERAKKDFTVDPEAKYPKGSWEEYFQKLEAAGCRAWRLCSTAAGGGRSLPPGLSRWRRALRSLGSTPHSSLAGSLRGGARKASPLFLRRRP